MAELGTNHKLGTITNVDQDEAGLKVTIEVDDELARRNEVRVVATVTPNDVQRAMARLAELCGMTAEQAEQAGRLAAWWGLSPDEIRDMEAGRNMQARRQAKRERTLLMLFVSIWRGEKVRIFISPDETTQSWTGPLLQRGLSDQQLRDHLEIVQMGELEMERVWPA